MTKKLLSLAFTLILMASGYGQAITSFPTEKDKFIKAIDQMMTASKADNLVQADDEFDKNVKGGAITDAQMEQIIATANVMAARSVAPYPFYYGYFTTINAFAKNKISQDKFANWMNVCNDLIKNQKKGDNRDLEKFLEFSVSFFRDNALFISASKTWTSDAKSYTLTYEGWKAILTLPECKLKGTTSTDTVYINNTSGKYIPTEKKWYGKAGKATWERNKLSASSVYAVFKTDYVVNFENIGYTVDSVEFFYKDFFATPLYGRFTDKFVGGGNDSAASYPRFDSKARDITLKEVVPNATYVGGFGLWGAKVMGFGVIDTPAAITFYKKDKTKALTAHSMSFTIKKGIEVGSPKAEIMIFNGADTIYHPELNLTYKAKSNELKLLRGESGVSKSKFFDSYHNHEFEVDAIIWNLDSPRMQLKTLNGVGQVGSVFESNNYFNRDRIRKIQGGAPYEPLSIIKKYAEKTGSGIMNAGDLAKAIDPHLTEEQTKALYYNLVEMGFIKYDESTGTVTMRTKVVNYVQSNAKKVDYDIIHIKSVPKTGIDYIDLKTNNVDLKGVHVVPISDTANVTIYPANSSVSIQKNRDMKFDGLVYGGRLDFFGKDYKFNYAPFTMDLNGLDSMRINIPDSSGKLDQNGQPLLRTLLTDIVGVKGMLEVDAPINKSGRAHLYAFPKLTSREKSYAYYDDPNIGGGAYKKKDFFFEILPFKLDSLNAFTPSVINWAGKLSSAGIFADIENKLHIMPDLSLGFDMTTPDGGSALYKDLGKYEGDMKLSHKGLSGQGKVDHLTASFTSHDIMFYPDSLRSVTDSFHIRKVSDGVKTPEVTSSGNLVVWRSKKDSMQIFMKDTPFAMYENQTLLRGNLLLTSKGLRGNGLLDWKEANLTSKDFQFKTDDMAADTAALNIKSISGDKVTFKTPNVNAKIDFKNHIGDFKSNVPDNPTEFAYNNFITRIPEFKWFIDQKILDFKVPPASKGEYFESTRESQKGLKFMARRATYNLETSVLRTEQVPFIYIADAKVVPDSGIVIIQGEGKIDELHNATIFVDTITNKHKIEKCTVNIISKAELRGSGEYKYTCKDHKDQMITFNDIKCTKESIGDKKNFKFDAYSLVAKGNIEEKDSFYIYPRVTYKGEGYLYGRNPYLFFKGFAQIHFRNPLVTNSDFRIIDDINPDKLILHYDSTTKSSDGSKVVTGIYFNKSGETPNLYHAIFTQVISHSDPAIFKCPGIVTYNEKTKEYDMGDEDKVLKGGYPGNIMKFNEEKSTMKGEGKLSLGADFGVIASEAAGTFEVDLNKKQYLFNMTFGIDMDLGNKSLNEKFQAIMLKDNSELKDISYENERFKMIYNNIADAKVDAKLIADVQAGGAGFKRPKDFGYYLVFTDVNFIYDPDDLTLRSYGQIGLSFVGDKGVHKKMDGAIEIGLKTNTFNIYFKTGTGEWFYFEYRPGNLGLVSSYDEYNKIVAGMTAVPPDKRKITGENGKFYTYNIGSTINKSAFIDAMQEKSSPLPASEKVNLRPKITNRDTTPKVAPKPVAPTDTKQGATDSTTKVDQAVPVINDNAAKPAEPKEKEKPKSAAQRRSELLKQKAGEDPTAAPASTPAPKDTMEVKPTDLRMSAPPDRQAPSAAPVAPKATTTDTVKPVAPVVTTPEPVKAAPVPVPAKDTTVAKPDAPKVTTTDTVKTIAPPVTTPEPAKIVPVPTPVKDTAVAKPVAPKATTDTVKTVAPPVTTPEPAKAVPVKDTTVAKPAEPKAVTPEPVKSVPAPPAAKDTAAVKPVDTKSQPAPAVPIKAALPVISDSIKAAPPVTMPADTSGKK